MLSVAEAQALVRAHVGALPAREAPLLEALGRMLAESVLADRDSPPFDKALVDGYAVRASDFEGDGTTFRVVEEVPAGVVPSKALGRREAAFIMTGAPLPAGADAVVMHETTRRDGDRVSLLIERLKPGENRLLRGAEMKEGDVVGESGLCLRPADLGLFASVGRTAVRVVPKARVVILPTGDELVEAHETPGPGRIRNSNVWMLAAKCEESRAAAATILPIVRDRADDLRNALETALERFDVVLITGGVSAGKYDLVPPTLESLGVRPIFHKIALRPGKPLLFGIPERTEGARCVFGLPGNPVSCLVGFELFVSIALAHLTGKPNRGGGETRRVRLGAPYSHRGVRQTYHPARWPGQHDGPALPLRWAGSADLRTVAQSDGFIVFPAGDRDYDAGETVDFLPT